MWRVCNLTQNGVKFQFLEFFDFIFGMSNKNPFEKGVSRPCVTIRNLTLFWPKKGSNFNFWNFPTSYSEWVMKILSNKRSPVPVGQFCNLTPFLTTERHSVAGIFLKPYIRIQFDKGFRLRGHMTPLEQLVIWHLLGSYYKNDPIIGISILHLVTGPIWGY